MAKAPRVDAGSELLDDLLLLVFERLRGLQDLLRCAATCKQWFLLVTDPVFLRRIGLWPETAPRPSVLVGIFFQNAISCSALQPLSRKPDSPPQFLSLQAGGAHLTFGSLVANDDGLFNFARPLASRRGLLLVSIVLPTTVDNRGREEFHLAVCRPLIDKLGRHLLPRPSFKVSGGLTGCALLTDEDHGVFDDLDQQQRRQPTFQVLLTYTAANRVMYVYMYSSATGKWRAPIKCPQVLPLRCGPFAGVVTRGTVHWLFTDQTSFYTLNVNAATAHVSLTKIPINVHSGEQCRRVPFPCVTGERELSFVSIRDDGVLELWAKQGQDDNNHGVEAGAGGWLRSDLINLGSDDKINLVFFAERRGAMLVEQGGAFFTIDLKSKEKAIVDLKGEEMEHVWGICRFPMHRCSSSWCSGFLSNWGKVGPCVYNKPVLYEADWIFDRHMLLASCRLEGKVRAD